MSKLIVIGGGKGGVGKSMVSIALLDMLLADGKEAVLIETDDSNPDAYKTMHSLVKSEICNIDSEEGFIRIGNVLEQHAGYVVINTAARSTEILIKYWNMITSMAREAGRNTIVLWLINRQRDSLELARLFLDKTSDCKFYILVNSYFGAPEKFTLYNTSKLRESHDGTMVIPELNDLVTDKLSAARLPLSTMDDLGLGERHAIHSYRTKIREALNGVIYG
jgi:KaiC/GvpD/RAD55 family RecA-like ATPase